jgi:hypothetical protein
VSSSNPRCFRSWRSAATGPVHRRGLGVVVLLQVLVAVPVDARADPNAPPLKICTNLTPRSSSRRAIRQFRANPLFDGSSIPYSCLGSTPVHPARSGSPPGCSPACAPPVRTSARRAANAGVCRAARRRTRGSSTASRSRSELTRRTARPPRGCRGPRWVRFDWVRKGTPWWLAGRKPEVQLIEPPARQSARVRQDHERGKVLVLSAQPVAQPGAHAGKSVQGEPRCSSGTLPGCGCCSSRTSSG